MKIHVLTFVSGDVSGCDGEQHFREEPEKKEFWILI